MEYTIHGAIQSDGSGLHTLEFLYLETSIFYLPDGATDTVRVNGQPVHLIGKDGFACHGCQMTLEYITGETIWIADVPWEERVLPFEIRTLWKVDQITFDQPAKSISFRVIGETTHENHSLITMIIPLDLLWEPYTIFLGHEVIHSSVYANNGTHVWLSIPLQSSGIITVVGTSVIPEFSSFLIVAIAMSLIVITCLVTIVSSPRLLRIS